MSASLLRLGERLELAAQRARRLGLDRLELRYQADDTETVRADCGRGEPEATDEVRLGAGIAARAFIGGAIGHAACATPRFSDGAEAAFDQAIETAIAEAQAAARAQAALGRVPFVETEEELGRGHHESGQAPKPVAADRASRLDFVREVVRALMTQAGDEGRAARAHASLLSSERAFASSDGARQTQRLYHAGGGMSLVVEVEGEREELSHPLGLGLVESTTRLAEEARALIRAPRCPEMRTTVILSPEPLCVQIHETVGQPLEGDRVLGEEKGSFVTPEMLGRFRYGSLHVNLVADATLPGAIGSFGWDDEGVAARRTPLVQRGQLVGLLSTRRVAARFGLPRSGGCLRAATFRDPPILRMTNVVLEADPLGPTLEAMIADTDHGILVHHSGGNRSGSFDDRRLRFELGCEAAWEIRGGRRTRLLRRPIYRGRTPSFWAGCDAVGRPEEARVYGLTHGKGEPIQLIGVGHGGPPARFRDVEVGSAP